MDERSRIEINVAICKIKRCGSNWTHNTYTLVVLIDGQVGRCEEVQSWKGYMTFGISSFFHQPYLYVIGEQGNANKETASVIIEIAKTNNIPCLVNLS